MSADSEYKKAGVDYDTLDAAKRDALASASHVSSVLALRGASSLDASRGEPAFVFRLGDRYIATVLECLGTKSTIARAVQEESGVNRFDAIGYDTVASIVNDIVCVGALPLSVNAYFATGSPDWYAEEGRFRSLVQGFARACEDSGATWGGGESPGLSGIVSPTEIDLAGSGVGAVPEGREPVLGQHLAPGDEIVLVDSSGMHTNGSSMARRVAGQLPDGYATPLPNGQTFGDAALQASEVYVALVDALLREHLPVTYLSHVTGHGFRKLMRADKDVTYKIHTVPEVPPALAFMVEQLQMTPESAYGTFNMGTGFAVYCAKGAGKDVVATAHGLGYGASVCGFVEDGPKQVVIQPLGVTYSAADLQLR